MVEIRSHRKVPTSPRKVPTSHKKDPTSHKKAAMLPTILVRTIALLL